MATFSANINNTLGSVSAQPVAATKTNISQMLTHLQAINSGAVAQSSVKPFLSGNTLYIVGGIAAVLVIAILIVLFKK